MSSAGLDRADVVVQGSDDVRRERDQRLAEVRSLLQPIHASLKDVRGSPPALLTLPLTRCAGRPSTSSDPLKRPRRKEEAAGAVEFACSVASEVCRFKPVEEVDAPVNRNAMTRDSPDL